MAAAIKSTWSCFLSILSGLIHYLVNLGANASPVFLVIGPWFYPSPSPLVNSADHQCLFNEISVIFWASKQHHCAATVTCVGGVFLLVSDLEICIIWHHFPLYTRLGWVRLISQQGSRLRIHPSSVEQFSIECRKTKTKVITLTNHNRRRQSNEPIRTRSKYM